ncbi:MAG: glycosyltransferase family 4 protein [Terracoccus sp.]
MKVGIVCPYSFDVPGGVQFHVRDLAEHLISHGHEVSVLAPADSETELPDYVVSAGRATAVRYNGSVARLNFGPVTASKVGRWLDAGAFDVLHLHEPVTPSVSVIALSACEGPIVATFHTSMIRSRTMQTAYPILRSNLEKIDARIAVSEDARRTVTTHVGGDAIVIPNGVYVDRFASAPRNPAWTGTRSRPTIAFLGRMGEPRKGLPVLAAALPEVLARVPGLRVLLAGPGDVREITAGLPPEVARACEFLGPVSDEDKASLLASVDVYVAPNTGGESFGIILIEAMSAGACVLASDLAAFSRVLDGGTAGAMFRNEEPADLAAVLLELVADPARRAALAAAGSQRARLFDWSVVAARIIAVYETVIEGRMAATAEPQTGWNRFLRGGIGR